MVNNVNLNDFEGFYMNYTYLIRQIGHTLKPGQYFYTIELGLILESFRKNIFLFITALQATIGNNRKYH